jgi:hypothetical protein
METPLPQEWTDSIRAGHSGIYAEGIINYNDTYGEERWTKFRLVYPIMKEFFGGEYVRMDFAEGGNDAN